jgi:ABC-type nitrate/sulfonate/bicarbonate transport system, ATPase component
MAEAQPLVSMRGVSKQFPGRDRTPQSPVFTDLNLDLKEHEFMCIVGPSGCGKSTLANLVAGLEQASSGAVLLEDRPITGPDRDRGLVFQSTDTLYDWLTVSENVALPLKVHGMPKEQQRETVREYLGLVGLEAAAGKYPGELSGGMKQRVQLARVLANNPRILLMDEPFGALDAQTRRTMQQWLADIWARDRKTVMFITHDIDEAIVLADRIVVMSKGPYSNIVEIIENTMERPRERGVEFLDLWNRIDSMLRGEVQEDAR